MRAQVDESSQDIEQVRAQELQARQAPVGGAPALRADEPHEHAEERHGGRQQDGRERIGEEHGDEHDDGRHRGDRTSGQEAAHVALDGWQLGDHVGGHLTRTQGARLRRREPRGIGDELLPQPAERIAGGAPARPFEPPVQQRSRGGCAEEHAGRRRIEPPVLRQRDDHRGERVALRRDESGDRQRCERAAADVPPHAGVLLEQDAAGIDAAAADAAASHLLGRISGRRGGRGGTRAEAASLNPTFAPRAVGATRWRNTQ